MGVVVKRISMAILLSTVLASGQAEANKLQGLRNQVRKVLGNPKTMDYAFLATGLGAAGLGISGMLGLSEHILVQMLFPFTGVSFLVLGNSINANLSNRHYAIAKRAGEASRLSMDKGAYQVIKMLAESKPEHEPVEVNDRANMLLKIFMWVEPPFAVNVSHIDAFIDENGGFPLTVARDGVTFNNGNHASYTELFG